MIEDETWPERGSGGFTSPVLAGYSQRGKIISLEHFRMSIAKMVFSISEEFAIASSTGQSDEHILMGGVASSAEVTSEEEGRSLISSERMLQEQVLHRHDKERMRQNWTLMPSEIDVAGSLRSGTLDSALASLQLFQRYRDKMNYITAAPILILITAVVIVGCKDQEKRSTSNQDAPVGESLTSEYPCLNEKSLEAGNEAEATVKFCMNPNPRMMNLLEERFLRISKLEGASTFGIKKSADDFC